MYFIFILSKIYRVLGIFFAVFSFSPLLIDFNLLCYVLLVMWMFSVFFLPAFFILYLLSHSDRNNFPSVLFGIGCGALYVVFAVLFGSDYRIYPVSFFKMFSTTFFQETFFPSLILTALFFLLSKDSLQFKMDKLVLVIAGFFTLYIPFRIFFRSETLSAFILFFKPVLLTCFVFGFSLATKLFIKNLMGDKKPVMFVIPCLLGLGCAALPGIAEVLWFGGSSFIVWLLLTLVQFVFVIILGILSHTKLDFNSINYKKA